MSKYRVASTRQDDGDLV